MRFKALLACREVAHLVLAGHDRRLRWVERLRLWLHWRLCRGCRHFGGQAALMRQALGQWRRYRDNGDVGPQDKNPP